MRKVFIVGLLGLASSLAFGQSTAVRTWNPENIVWQRTDSDGTKWAVLQGDKEAPGKAFTYAFFIPAGHWEHHFHNQDARVAVVSGALKVAVGPELDKSGAKTYPAGSFLYEPANIQHTMGADVDTICISSGRPVENPLRTPDAPTLIREISIATYPMSGSGEWSHIGPLSVETYN